jgi:hypothetical protein
MTPALQKYLLSLEEETLYELLKETIYPDLVRNSDEATDSLDYYLPPNSGKEFKCRKEPEFGSGQYYSYMIEKHKYDAIINKYDEISYICSGGNGIFEWDLKNYPEEINWIWEPDYTWSTRYANQDKKNKEVAYLPIHYAKYLHPLVFEMLFQNFYDYDPKKFLYPFDYNRLM